MANVVIVIIHHNCKFIWLALCCMQAMYGARKWRTLAVVSILQAFQQQKTNPYQQVVILVQVRCCRDWAPS
jgi:hypothetical protein